MWNCYKPGIYQNARILPIKAQPTEDCFCFFFFEILINYQFCSSKNLKKTRRTWNGSGSPRIPERRRTVIGTIAIRIGATGRGTRGGSPDGTRPMERYAREHFWRILEVSGTTVFRNIGVEDISFHSSLNFYTRIREDIKLNPKNKYLEANFLEGSEISRNENAKPDENWPRKCMIDKKLKKRLKLKAIVRELQWLRSIWGKLKESYFREQFFERCNGKYFCLFSLKITHS